jgi:hypothetical protein
MVAAVQSQLYQMFDVALESEPSLPDPDARRPHNYGWLEPLVASLDPVDLSAITSAALLDRTEVKYLMGTATLGAALEQLGDGYMVLSVDGHRINRYRTLYFDTQQFTMYHRNLAGGGARYKVRAREYVETSTTFFEIKRKTNKDRTIKSRIPTTDLATTIEGHSAQFLEENCPFDAGELLPCLWNRYLRITPVHKEHPERVTIDFDLSFEWRDRRVALPGIVVAEVKMQGAPRLSDFIGVMRENHVRRTGFSKFCVGVSLVYPEIKQNRLRKKHRQLARLMQGNAHGPG